MTDGVVLIADPDVAAREQYKLGLARAGYRVVSAGDGTAALRLANRLVPDDLLTEILLPNLDGFHLAQRLRRQAKTRDINIVAVTSDDGEDLRRRATECGIDAVLSKTRSIHDVVQVLRTTRHNSRALTRKSELLREAVNHEIYRGYDLRARAEDLIAQSRQVAGEIARAIGADTALCVDREMLAEADGARDVILVDRTRGEQLFAMLLERYADHPVLHFKRGEAYRAIGRRKLAYQEFVLAAERLPDGVWRERARFAAMRTRSHHEPSK